MQRPEIHAAAAEGFEREAQRYQRGRPDYPASVRQWLREDLALSTGGTAIDLGAGTGRFSRWLSETGAQVIAVEPVAAMRSRIAESAPEVRALEGAAEAIPLPDASADAVVCAQSFHWFTTEEAVREIHRVLRPGGAFGLIWNVRDEAIPWVAELTRLVAPYEQGVPRYASGQWRTLFPAPGFGPLHERSFPHIHAGPAESVIVDRTLSVSFIAALPDSEKAQVARQVRELIARTPELMNRTEVAFPYRTEVYWCLKKVC